MEAQEKLESVPKTWPKAFGLFKYSKAAIGFNVWTIVILIVLSVLVNMVISSLFTTTVDNADLYRSLNVPVEAGMSTEVQQTSPLGNLLSFVASIIISVAMYKTMFAGIARVKMSALESFKAIDPMVALRLVGLNILVSIILFVSFIAFIVPFFFVLPRLMMASLYVIDGGMGVMEAIKASWNDSKGNVGKVYGIIGANIVFALIAVTIIGIPVAIFLLVAYSAAYPLLYKYITSQKTQPSVAQA